MSKCGEDIEYGVSVGVTKVCTESNNLLINMETGGSIAVFDCESRLTEVFNVLEAASRNEDYSEKLFMEAHRGLLKKAEKLAELEALGVDAWVKEIKLEKAVDDYLEDLNDIISKAHVEEDFPHSGPSIYYDEVAVHDLLEKFLKRTKEIEG